MRESRRRKDRRRRGSNVQNEDDAMVEGIKISRLQDDEAMSSISGIENMTREEKDIMAADISGVDI